MTERVRIDNQNENETVKEKDKNILTEDNQKMKKESKISIIKMVINLLLSIFLIALTYFVINNYNQKWVMPFYLTLWSFFMNAYYIISVTVVELIRFFKNSEYCRCYNDFVRNKYLRVCFPFSISIVFLYWLLILLGDEFEYNSRGLMDNLVAFCFHGLIFIFLLFDTLSYPHINLKKNIKLDLIIITLMTFIYFLLLGFGKYLIRYEPYDFMEMSNERQIAGAAFLIYIAVLDGYIAFLLFANKFFIQEDEVKSLNLINETKNNENTQTIKLIKSGTIKNEDNLKENDKNNNLTPLKNLIRRRKLKPIILKKKGVENEEFK